MDYSFLVFNNIYKLKDIWQEILSHDSEATVFQTYELNKIWCEHHTDQQPHIYVAVFKDRVVGILPFTKTKVNIGNGNTVQYLENMGNQVFDYFNIIAIDEFRSDILKNWMEYLASSTEKWDFIEMNFIPDINSLYKMERNMLPKPVMLQKRYYKNLHIILNGFDEYLDSLTPKRRKKFLGYLKMIDQDKNLVLYKDKSAQATEDFINMHTKRWEHVAKAGIFQNEEIKNMFREMSITTEYSALYLKYRHEILGAICYFDYRSCRYFYQSAISPVQTLSVGNILLIYCIRDASLNGLKTFDFLNGKEMYKYKFTHVGHEVISLSLYHNQNEMDQNTRRNKQIRTKIFLSKTLPMFHQQFLSLKKYQLPDNKRILIISPHFDDEVIGCGGLLHYCSEHDSPCDILFLTDGAENASPYSSDVLPDLRKRESLIAQSYLGQHNHFYLNFADGFLSESRALRKAIMELVDFKKYGHIFVPPPYDKHGDHRAAFQLAVSIVKITHSKSVLFTYESMFPLNDANTYLNIYHSAGYKFNAMKCFTSQMYDFDYVQAVRKITQQRDYRELYTRIYE